MTGLARHSYGHTCGGCQSSPATARLFRVCPPDGNISGERQPSARHYIVGTQWWALVGARHIYILASGPTSPNFGNVSCGGCTCPPATAHDGQFRLRARPATVPKPLISNVSSFSLPFPPPRPLPRCRAPLTLVPHRRRLPQCPLITTCVDFVNPSHCMTHMSLTCNHNGMFKTLKTNLVELDMRTALRKLFPTLVPRIPLR